MVTGEPQMRYAPMQPKNWPLCPLACKPMSSRRIKLPWACSHEGEAAASSISRSMRIDNWINERGPHLVVCSIGCLQKIDCLKALWPREAEEESWRILRGAEAFLDGPAT